MKLYEIDAAMDALIDPETGEVMDVQAFDALAMEKGQKIENVACWAKNEKALAEEIGAEIKRLQERKKAAENRAERLKGYLLYATGGQKYQTARAQISFRSSESTEITDEAGLIEWAESNGYDELLKYRQPEISKTAVKETLKSGVMVPGAQLVTSTSVIIK